MISMTIAIPTRNRPGFLVRAVRTVLRQTYADFELIILDNGSADLSWRDLPEFADPRVRIVCHPTNIGVVNNWNAAVEEARGDAICIFHDDDLMYPRYVEAMLDLLERYPSAGMALSRTRRVDCEGTPLGMWWMPEGFAQQGLVPGREYLMQSLRMIQCFAIPSSITIRRSAYAKVGRYGGVSQSAFDLGYYMRVASQFDIAVIDETLIDYTQHPGQICEGVWRALRPEGLVDNCLEVLGAAASLLDEPVLSDETRREIAETLRELTTRMAEYVQARTLRGPM
jgi:glycosyltransferase involved in cell wall biosynthesis